jgi:hypothetical protein
VFRRGAFHAPCSCMHDFPSIPLEIRHCILSVEFVIAAVHAKAISAFVVPEGKGRGVNGDPSAGTAAPLKKLAAKHNARCILNSLSEFRRNLACYENSLGSGHRIADRQEAIDMVRGWNQPLAGVPRLHADEDAGGARLNDLLVCAATAAACQLDAGDWGRLRGCPGGKALALRRRRGLTLSRSSAAK